MAGGYDGSLRFNTKIDEDGFLRTVKDLERSLTALEQTVGKLTKVMQAGFSQASTGAEQAAADVAKLSDAADTAAENFSQLPDSETVTVQAETHGITEAQTALDSMEQNELINVMCFIKDKYRAAISGDVCCVREISGNEAKIEIFENSSFRKCTVPIEVLDIHEGLMTISEMCHEIELCASRYLQEHHIEQVSPDSENYERWKIEKSFLRSWTQPNNHFYGSEQTICPLLKSKR